MEIPGKLVVRTYAPARRWIMLAIVLLLGSLALYVVFELGRFTAGYDAMQAAAERDALQLQINQQQQSMREMRVQLAAAEEARVSEVRERSEVARTIGELQAQVERQQQDVEFYRGLVAQPNQAKDAVLVGVQQFHIASLQGNQRFALRFSLNRQQRPGEPLSGVLGITVDGTKDGVPVSASLADLTGAKNELLFSVRYTTSIDQEVILPGDFKPERVTIELRPDKKGISPYRQTFVWRVDPS
ncbi:MAG TPA: DUF6776 family protein [Steroidobacteraceae bacterium]|jgi:hypothetical protein|nr:DUF6776 family protein [Steroidobacteraceae bacterium]